ncbi:MAG TPA: phytanoyl-CoA dioxygenase family protein [Tepidisphaeraceae bacterium]|nr:phytanoyl-CoA dioxygenase family protein [Tepidisphaeraceae bacterium]
MEQFRRDGFVAIRGVFSAAEIASVRDTFMAMNANGPVEGLSEFRRPGSDAYTSTDPLAFYPRMMHPHLHPDKPVGPVAKRYMMDERLHRILFDLMEGVEPLAVQSMFYFKPPGARGQDLHQDDFYLRTKPGNCMAAWVAVDDADEENGGMVCVPGTADYDVVCPEKSDPTKFFTTEHVEPPPGTAPVPVRLEAGDVLFFNGRVIHGSYPNTSRDRFRRSLICHYVPENSTELSHWYRFPTRFDGKVVEIAEAVGGGPCGTPHAATAPH